MKRWIGPVLSLPVTGWLLLAFAAPMGVVVLLIVLAVLMPIIQLNTWVR